MREKVLGSESIRMHVEMEGMVYASAVRSKYPRARILDIHTEKAEALPGVLAVLTADDVPNNKVGHLQQDWDVMIAKGSVTRCVGDAICLVVAETREILEKAKKLVKIDYEELKPVTSITEAMAEDAPKVHSKGNLCQSRHVTRGDAKKALAESKYVVTQTYRTPFTEHAFLEPESAVAFPYKDGVKVLSSDQGVYDTRKEISIMLGWDPERVVVENKLVGGGFGGKEDVSTQHIAALAALKVNRPVKVTFSRQESINFHRSAMPWRGHLPSDAMRMVSLPVWTVRFILTQVQMHLCADLSLKGPAPILWDRTVIRNGYPGIRILYEQSAGRRIPWIRCVPE